jgi:hypothetical protein
VLVDQCGVDTKRMPNLQRCQIAFERVAEEDSVRCNERVAASDEGFLDGFECMSRMRQLFGSDTRPPACQSRTALLSLYSLCPIIQHGLPWLDQMIKDILARREIDDRDSGQFLSVFGDHLGLAGPLEENLTISQSIANMG